MEGQDQQVPAIPPEPPTLSPNPFVPKQNIILVVLSLSVVILAGLMGYLAYQNRQLQKKAMGLPTVAGLPTPTVVATPTVQKITLPVVVLKTGYGAGPPDQIYPYPKSIGVAVSGGMGGQLGAYGVGDMVVVGPKGWTGSGAVGADGTTSVGLFPVGGSATAGPRIVVSTGGACMGCIYDEAAPYFPEVRQLETTSMGISSGLVPTAPPGMVSNFINPHLVQYSLPKTADGMEVNGVAYFNKTGQVVATASGQPKASGMDFFEGMEVMVPPAEHDLGLTLLQIFVEKNNFDNPEGQAVAYLVDNFYMALANQDGKTLFSLMTPAGTTEEKGDYSWLTGADLGANQFYRVFLRAKITGPQITDMQKVSDIQYQVGVADQLQGWANAGPSAGTWSSPQSRNIEMAVVKVNGAWLVDKFTDLARTTGGGNAGAPKYNGFGQ